MQPRQEPTSRVTERLTLADFKSYPRARRAGCRVSISVGLLLLCWGYSPPEREETLEHDCIKTVLNRVRGQVDCPFNLALRINRAFSLRFRVEAVPSDDGRPHFALMRMDERWCKELA